jgi:hypothetical protein
LGAWACIQGMQLKRQIPKKTSESKILFLPFIN